MIDAIASLPPDAGLDADLTAKGAGASTLIIACGALARELVAVVRASAFPHVAITCLPANLHNHPQRITAAVRAKIQAARGRYRRIVCLYGDCGTGGELDRMLAEEGVERIDGAHCYAFFAGADTFDGLMEEEPGTFFLTDYLVRHFDKLVINGLGLDRHPELLTDYFGNYRRVVHLAQVADTDLSAKARAAATRLGLAFESRFTGLDALSAFVRRTETNGQAQA